ncbi:MAG: nicotinic acid mononucleotide adenylyltransferase [Verrucomicrobia bacterium]|nr:nicotinic acid mononucleotide adenylyltransferase [Verrucomicrobiota bacterium]
MADRSDNISFSHRNMTTKRIGILGGTFNPIHIGHLILGQTAHETLELGKVLFIPCNQPAHKPGRGLAPSEHRLAMVHHAIEHDLRFELCDIEIRRGGISYAIDTVRELGLLYPGAELFFIIGADTLRELHLWKKAHDLLNLCQFVTFSRPGYDVDNVKPAEIKLEEPWPQKLIRNVRPCRLIDISSSDIRHRIAEGLGISYLVPQAVDMYIMEHRLYSR